MEITIKIECEYISQLRIHLKHIDEQIVKKVKSENLEQYTDEFKDATGLDDNNCYGSHTVEITKEFNKDEHEGTWIEQGLYYGYPDCCIMDFCKRASKVNEPTEAQGKASLGTGFIPCPSCTELVNAGQLTLQDLIKDRVCEAAFPFGTNK